jgi:prepilin-type N-terminal cleavage/methylation domain-containing protein
MPEMTASSVAPRKNRAASFTLVEMLTVMAIIAILSALMLFAANGVMQKAKRTRASSEIQGMSTALESYKTDNGNYPQASGLTTNNYTTDDGSTNVDNHYQISSEVLYQALSGQANFNDTHQSTNKSYMAFKVTQLGNYTAIAGTASPNSTYVRDPWNYSYGYSTGTAVNYPYNGTGFFDLWSTGGALKSQWTTTPALTNAWISNWQSQ